MNAQDLYGLPLERFVPERTALAKALRQEGRREEGANVATLRKPSLAAWAVNQLVRTQRREINDLFGAGDALQRAHSEVLEGRGDAGTLRDALSRERDAVDELVEKARGLLSSDGQALTPATLERVSDTLHAAALEADAREQVKEGCLHRELRHVGIGAGGVAGAPATTGTRARRGETSRDRAGRPRGGPAHAQDRGERAKQLSAARKAEADARRESERAARALQIAEERRDRAADALHEAEEAVAGARRRAQEADRAHEQARRALDQARHPAG